MHPWWVSWVCFLPLIAGVVKQRRANMTRIIREAFSTSGLTIDRIVRELEVGQGNFTHQIDKGTIHAADLFALPDPAFTKAVSPLLARRGVITVTHALHLFGLHVEAVLTALSEAQDNGGQRRTA